ncbi:MAG: hypothetical protein P1Q69_03510 [Candidatus Thorarchaeota archaeon]|nr:hypothetical protein [Candidatus Thorarchaeota archaeon]
MKSKNIVRNTFLLVILFSMTLAISVQPADAIYIEYLGRETVDRYVPFFALYDPPGDASYTKVAESTSHNLKVRFVGASQDSK